MGMVRNGYESMKGNIITVYTDGSYHSDRGGFGYVIAMRGRFKQFKSKYHWVDTTNNRMEIRPILEALERISTGYTIDVYTDSTYCCNAINKYLRLGRMPDSLVKNRKLWGLLFDVISNHLRHGSEIRAKWVRGHSGNRFNEIADGLAMESRASWDPKVCGRRSEMYADKKRVTK